MLDNNARMQCNHSILAELELSKFYEWIQITVARHTAVEDKALLVKLRRNISLHLPLLAGNIVETRFNITAIITFLEFIYPIRFIVFTLRDRLLASICNPFAFKSIRE